MKRMLSQSLDVMQRIKDDGHDSVILLYSGGKDSVACMHLAVQFGFTVHPVYLYFFKGTRIEEEPIERAERRFGVTIRRMPNPALHSTLREGMFIPRPLEFRRKLKQADIIRVMRDRTGAWPVILGQRKDESLQRRGMISSDGDWNARLGKAYPLAEWNAKSVWAYIRRHRLTNLVADTGFWDTSGIALGTACLFHIRDNYPEDWEIIKRRFPLAETMIKREEQRKRLGLPPSQRGLKI